MKKHINEYREHATYFEIVLYKPNTYEELTVALISKEDFNKANNIFWKLSEYGYARGYDSITRKEIFLHKYLSDTTEDIVLDHINRNKLDCRRENLRIANKQINSINRNLQPNSTTGYRGISIDKRRNKYRAHIKIDGRQIGLGYFAKLEDAIAARKKAEEQYFNISI